MQPRRDVTGLRPPSLLARTSYLAGSVSQLGRNHLAPLLKERGLQFSQYAVLAALSDVGQLAPHELATRLRTDRSHVSAHLETLLRRGLVEREPDPADRRRLLVTITDAGQTLAAQVAASAADTEDYLLAGLDDVERGDLRRLLMKVLITRDAEHRVADGPTAATDA